MSSQIATGLGYGGVYRQSWAGPVAEKVFSVNGYDPNNFFGLRTGAWKEVGLDAPGAPTLAAGSGTTPSSTAVTFKTVAANFATLTSVAHGLVVGQGVTVDIADNTYNGSFVLTAVTADTLTYALTHGNEGSTATTGTVAAFVALATSKEVTSAGVTTITTRVNHGFIVGQAVRFINCIYPTFQTNSPFTITAVTSTTFSFAFPARTSGTGYDLSSGSGMDVYIGSTPASVPATMAGTYRYRLRRWDAVNKTLSLPGPATEITVVDTQTVVTFPTEPTQRSGCNCIVERTTNNGQVFFPVNTASSEDGTPWATGSYTDSYVDNARLTNVAVLGEFQGRPRVYPLAEDGDNRLFLAGAIQHRVTVTATNGSATISTAAAAFLARMAGLGYSGDRWYITFGDTDGSSYVVTTFTDTTHLILDRVYAGTTGTKSAILTAPANRVAWSETGLPEYFGEAVATGVKNETPVGDAAAVTSIQYLGKLGGLARLVVAKYDSLHVMQWTLTPAYTDGGRVVQLAGRRGALGTGMGGGRSMLAVEGVVYGIDALGIWAMAAGGEPQEIAGALRGDWQNHVLDFTKGDEFDIQFEPDRRRLLFWVVRAGETKPQRAYVYDVTAQRFVGTRLAPATRSAGVSFVDGEGRMRAASYLGTASGTVPALLLAHNIGKADGMQTTIVGGSVFGFGVGDTPVASVVVRGAYSALTTYAANDQVTSGGRTYISLVGANLGNAVTDATKWVQRSLIVAGAVYTGLHLAGVPVRLTRAADGSVETRQIVSHGNNSLTADWTGAYPAAGDTVNVGGVTWDIWTIRMDGGAADRKKTWLRLWMRIRKKTSSVVAPVIYVKTYADGKAAISTPVTDREALSEDQVAQTASGAIVAVTGNSTLNWQWYKVPLNGLKSIDIQFHIYGVDGDVPVEFMAPMEIEFEVDDAEIPRR